MTSLQNEWQRMMCQRYSESLTREMEKRLDKGPLWLWKVVKVEPVRRWEVVKRARARTWIICKRVSRIVSCWGDFRWRGGWNRARGLWNVRRGEGGAIHVYWTRAEARPRGAHYTRVYKVMRVRCHKKDFLAAGKADQEMCARTACFKKVWLPKKEKERLLKGKS